MRTIRIGKSSSNDYVISNPTVSRSHAVITVDADGQHDICNITRIYECLLSKDAPDIVIGSRFFKESKSFAISFVKKLAIRFFQKAIYAASRS